MQVISSISELTQFLNLHRQQQNTTIGLVPTMGYLHPGHQRLINTAKSSCSLTVVSIFVNPLQFGPNEDFNSYPRNLEHDLQVCKASGVDIVFAPATEELIDQSLAYVEIKELGDHLCGAKRAGHFRGVCTIVAKLFNLIQPQKAFFGKKDIQQLQIIKQMVKDLHYQVAIIGVDTLRNSDGLALSSRNSYLSPNELKNALIIPTLLNSIAEQIKAGSERAAILEDAYSQIISRSDCRIDYIDIVDASRLQPTANFNQDLIIAIAMFVGTTRLIDNKIIGYAHAN